MSPFHDLDSSLVQQLNALVAQGVFTQNLTFVFALYGVYVIPITWFIAWFFLGKDNKFRLFSSMAAGILAWQVVNRVLKVFIYHDRPSSTLPVHEILFERPENSFPSDHVAFLAGIGFFFLLQKRFWPATWLLILAACVGVARIGVAVHYPSDIVIGFVTGLVGAFIVNTYHQRLSRSVWAWLLGIARKLRLA